MDSEYKLYKSIVLDGKIEYCNTHDDNDSTIGVKSYKKIKKFDGTYVEVAEGEFPLSKNMAEIIGWNKKYASIQMLTGDTPIDLDHLDETKIVSMEGLVDSEYYHRYSDYTGYLWTEEDFKCGGHDLIKILSSHKGEYIHLEIDLYTK